MISFRKKWITGAQNERDSEGERKQNPRKTNRVENSGKGHLWDIKDATRVLAIFDLSTDLVAMIAPGLRS